ncbi:hypothetical protein Ptr902_00062 [Pyrenophora tritici-repentis]|nr:hypothetical protein L13192_00064 [Pyrenophora tritici-repentis]KAI2485929.1 hypothetical protein Ptr902_00062 [Pyrenophora tritici-repentis]
MENAARACVKFDTTHAAHVIDKAVAPDLSKLCRPGLVNLTRLGDFDNAMYLCPAEHAASNARDAGVVISPRTSTSSSNTSAVGKRILHRHPREGGTKGLYTAYMVVDYQENDRMGPPWTSEWYGDPGADLWKV